GPEHGADDRVARDDDPNPPDDDDQHAQGSRKPPLGPYQCQDSDTRKHEETQRNPGTDPAGLLNGDRAVRGPPPAISTGRERRRVGCGRDVYVDDGSGMLTVQEATSERIAA